MKQRMIFVGALIGILMCLCSTKPVSTKPVYFQGTMVSPGIN